MITNMDVNAKNINRFWKQILTNKNYKNYKKVYSINHVTGNHLDFYLRPFNILQKEKPEIVIKNKLLKQMIDLNVLAEKNIKPSKEVLNVIEEQLKIISSNPSYWIRHGFSQVQTDDITQSYLQFERFIEAYKKNYYHDKIFSKKKSIYNFFLLLNLGYNVDSKKLQKMAIDEFNAIRKKVESLTKKSLSDSKNDYLLNRKKMHSPTNIISKIHQYLQEIKKECATFFKSSHNFIDPKRIVVKQMPDIIARWNTRTKAVNELLMINVNGWDLLDENMLLQICIKECIPGAINLRIINKGNKFEMKKRALKGVNAFREGFFVWCENLFHKSFLQNGELFLLFQQLFYASKIIIDVGLHTNNAMITFNNSSAIEFMKKYTLCDEHSATAEVLNILSRPGNGCCSGFGYYVIKYLSKKCINIGMTNIEFNDLLISMPWTFAELDNFFSK